MMLSNGKVAKMPDKKLTDVTDTNVGKMTYNEIKKGLEDEIHLAEYVDSGFCNGVSLSLIKSTLDLINRQKKELEKLRAYIHDNGLEWDLLSYCKKNETSKKNKCEYCINEICVNADCPMRADYCPVYNTPDVCRYEKRGE